MFKAIVTFSYGNGSMYSEHVRYFEAETEEILRENALLFRDRMQKGSSLHISEVGSLLDEYGSEFVSERD